MKIFIYLLFLINLSLCIIYYNEIQTLFKKEAKLEFNPEIVNNIEFINLKKNSINKYLENTHCIVINVFEDITYAKKISDYLGLFDMNVETEQLKHSYPIYEILAPVSNKEEANTLQKKLITLNIRALYNKELNVLNISGQTSDKEQINQILKKIKTLNIKILQKDNYYTKTYHMLKLKSLSAIKFVSNNFEEKIKQGFQTYNNIRINTKAQRC